MAIKSRAKGAAGELEWSQELKKRGYEARRGQQFSGGGDSPDVVHNIRGVHFEVKRTNALRLHEAMNQARRDAPIGAMPTLVHRCDLPKRPNPQDCRGRWHVTLSADDYFELLREAGRGPISAA